MLTLENERFKGNDLMWGGVRNCKISSKIIKATNTNKPEGESWGEGEQGDAV